jgi:uncharacterized protein YodC (DUF2158 family)
LPRSLSRLRIEGVDPHKKGRVWHMADRFRAGDVVRLKGGGPPMTVAYDPEEGGAVYLTWRDQQSGAVRTLEASASVLEKAGA